MDNDIARHTYVLRQRVTFPVRFIVDKNCCTLALIWFLRWKKINVVISGIARTTSWIVKKHRKLQFQTEALYTMFLPFFFFRSFNFMNLYTCTAV